MAGLATPAQWLVNALRGMLGGGEDETDEPMTGEKALGSSAVWYAVNRIANHVGQLPFMVYRTTAKGAEKQYGHPVTVALKERPNPYQTPFVFKSQGMGHALLWGNWRAAIVRTPGQIELIPLLPDRTITVMVDGKKFHVTKPCKGDLLTEVWTPTVSSSKDKDLVVLEDKDVFHIPGFSTNGVDGMSLIEVARRSWAIGIGSDKKLQKFYQQGYSGSMMLEAPAGAFRKVEDAKQFLEEFRKEASGADNSGKINLLREGIKANVMQMSSKDSEWVEHRKQQRQEVALWFLLESILGDDSSVSYNSLEQKNLAYLSNCLMRWLKACEEEADWKLLTPNERKDHYTKFNTAALLRSDFQTTAATLSTLITAKVITRNEARDKLEMNQVEGGDVFENPAIDANKDREDAMDKPDNKAMVAHLEHMIETEAARVIAGCGKPNFCQWLDKFYDGWESTLAKAIERLGGDGLLAKTYCEASKGDLLDVAGNSTEADLRMNVTNCVKTWQPRAVQLTQQIQKGVIECSE